ncbi:hypothetical protein INR49_000103 [Caranx melampygus]|nr:hypothetical protein INR49_000103 [Caranx melampygus]
MGVLNIADQRGSGSAAEARSRGKCTRQVLADSTACGCCQPCHTLRKALLTQLSNLTWQIAQAELPCTTRLRMVKLLLNKGANLSAIDKKETAYPLCCYLGMQGMWSCEVLVSRSADKSCKDKQGYTPLHAAAASGHIEIVSTTEDGGRDDEPNSFGNTALHVACYMGQEAVATELVNHGANVNQQTSVATPLCTWLPSPPTVPSVWSCWSTHGADVNQQSKEGRAPCHGAIHGRFNALRSSSRTVGKLIVWISMAILSTLLLSTAMNC